MAIKKAIIIYEVKKGGGVFNSGFLQL